MARIYQIITLCFLSMSITAQDVQLEVRNGYGSGMYTAGDTVHIWAETPLDTSSIFHLWDGDQVDLFSNQEWHTQFVMPDADVSVEARFRDMPDLPITFERIQGAEIEKPVYHLIPEKMQGLILIFHGTGGSAAGWIHNTEQRQFVDACIASGFGVIITESEESTLQQDLNGDDKIRWQPFPADTSINIDYRNINIILNTLRDRFNIPEDIHIFSAGMSNGGAFSAAISTLFDFNAGVSYTAPGANAVNEVRENPFAWWMARFDDNENVGPEGNEQARLQSARLIERGVCTDFSFHNRQPLYPERFARIRSIDIMTSGIIYDELHRNGHVDRSDFAVPSDTIINAFIQNPINYPVLRSLTGQQRRGIISQISASNAEHQFFSDFNHKTLSFFNGLCNITSLTDAPSTNALQFYPNPFIDQLYLKNEKTSYYYKLYNIEGRLIWQNNSLSNIQDAHLKSGMYYIAVYDDDWKIYTQTILKQ